MNRDCFVDSQIRIIDQKGPLLISKIRNMREDIQRCSRLKNIVIPGLVLGSGSFGTVYKATALVDDYKEDLAIKVSIHEYTDQDEYDLVLEKNNDEINFAKEMSDMKIGPTVYDAFYVIVPTCAINILHPDSKQIMDRVRSSTVYQYLFMESMDDNCANVIRKEWKNKTDKSEERIRYIFKEMMAIIHKQLYYYDLFCKDIKPDNFLINFKTERIKMIDYGIYCSNSIFSELSENEKGKLKVYYIIYQYILLFIYSTKYIDSELAHLFYENRFFKLLKNENFTKDFLNFLFDERGTHEHYEHSLLYMLTHYSRTDINGLILIINHIGPDIIAYEDWLKT